jgi:predicted secreted Zn-dependent protease
MAARQLKQVRKEYESSIQEHEAKYQKTCREHDHRITQLSKSHARQCEDLCREILKANSEADRLQGKLTRTKTQKIMNKRQDSLMSFGDDDLNDPGFDRTNVYLLLGIILLVSRLFLHDVMYLRKTGSTSSHHLL